MAKAGPKDTKKKTAATPGGSMRGNLFGHGVLALAVCVTFALVAATHDLHFVDLRHSLHSLAAYLAVAATLLAATAHGITSMTAGKRIKQLSLALETIRSELEEKRDADAKALEDRFGQLSTDLSTKTATVSEKVEQFLGAEFKRLSAENDQFRKMQDEARSAENQKANTEIETLRARNAELEEKINQWAIDSVGEKLGAKKLHVA